MKTKLPYLSDKSFFILSDKNSFLYDDDVILPFGGFGRIWDILYRDDISISKKNYKKFFIF